MRAEKQSPPQERTGSGLKISGQRSETHYNPYARASVKTLEQNLTIILAAADRMAAGYTLAWSDHERLHEAYQFVLPVLASLRGREVYQ